MSVDHGLMKRRPFRMLKRKRSWRYAHHSLRRRPVSLDKNGAANSSPDKKGGRWAPHNHSRSQRDAVTELELSFPTDIGELSFPTDIGEVSVSAFTGHITITSGLTSDADFTGAASMGVLPRDMTPWEPPPGLIAQHLHNLATEAIRQEAIKGTLEAQAAGRLRVPIAQALAFLDEVPADAAGGEQPGAIAGLAKLRHPQLLKELGRGAFGRVYKCIWKGKVLAVKIKSTPYGVDDEIEVLKHLARAGFHHGLTQLLGWGTKAKASTTLLFLPLADADLRSLLSQLRAGMTRLECAHMQSFTGALCSAVAYMHSQRVLHRDLKPGNILVRKRDPQLGARDGPDPDAAIRARWWMPMIADFGNALICACNPARQLPKRRFCTLQYAAPEVLLRGMEYSFPSDIWSMGVTLAEMELLEAVVPARGPDECDLTQLRRVWRWCFAVGVTRSDDSLDVRIRLELESRCAGTSLRRHAGGSAAPIGSIYGSHFAEVVRRFVQLEPANRVASHHTRMPGAWTWSSLDGCR